MRIFKNILVKSFALNFCVMFFEGGGGGRSWKCP